MLRCGRHRLPSHLAVRASIVDARQWPPHHGISPMATPNVVPRRPRDGSLLARGLPRHPRVPSQNSDGLLSEALGATRCGAGPRNAPVWRHDATSLSCASWGGTHCGLRLDLRQLRWRRWNLRDRWSNCRDDRWRWARRLGRGGHDRNRRARGELGNGRSRRCRRRWSGGRRRMWSGDLRCWNGLLQRELRHLHAAWWRVRGRVYRRKLGRRCDRHGGQGWRWRDGRGSRPRRGHRCGRAWRCDRSCWRERRWDDRQRGTGRLSGHDGIRRPGRRAQLRPRSDLHALHDGRVLRELLLWRG